MPLVAVGPCPEDILDRVLARLQSKLPEALAALKEAYTTADTIKWTEPLDLDPPLEDSYYFGAQQVISEFPAVLVDVDREEHGEDGRAYQSFGKHVVVAKGIVEIYIADDVDEKTSRRMLRYARAARQVLQQDSTLDDFVKGGRVRETIYGAGALGGGGGKKSRLFRVVTIPVEYIYLSDSDFDLEE